MVALVTEVVHPVLRLDHAPEGRLVSQRPVRPEHGQVCLLPSNPAEEGLAARGGVRLPQPKLGHALSLLPERQSALDRGAKMAVEMFLWLCNRPMPRGLKGGQSWLGAQNRFNVPQFIATQYGVPPELADWPACLDDDAAASTTEQCTVIAAGSTETRWTTSTGTRLAETAAAVVLRVPQLLVRCRMRLRSCAGSWRRFEVTCRRFLQSCDGRPS